MRDDHKLVGADNALLDSTQLEMVPDNIIHRLRGGTVNRASLFQTTLGFPRVPGAMTVCKLLLTRKRRRKSRLSSPRRWAVSTTFLR